MKTEQVEPRNGGRSNNPHHLTHYPEYFIWYALPLLQTALEHAAQMTTRVRLGTLSLPRQCLPMDQRKYSLLLIEFYSPE